ncbi:MAG: hypothetical protein PW844_19060 [Pantoea sp.]|uniref:hypothetical protein n=1 Tax=Pantoea sp. TaxID=69393 RepID=UPI002389CB34|nr:hypothetical protein [Pantoea sp.]MDE1188549.1 hypothetical protein [Pantoea sp.]
MSDIPQMKRPWSVVGAGFNDEGVYFTFDDTAIHRSDINLMQAAPEIFDLLKLVVEKYEQGFVLNESDIGECKSVLNKALGQ